MFRLTSLKLVNFRSYRGEHFFEFPTSNGLFFLTGKNSVEPALGSNGAGKSTLLDAIVWILYGRTTRGLKANEVISDWGASSCQGTLQLTVGTPLTVYRSQKPNHLLLNDKIVDQEELQKHIRLNFESFLCSVLIPQFGQSFFDKSPSEKLTLFSDIMNLDYWLSRSQDAANIAADAEFNLNSFQKLIDKKTGHIDAIKADLQTLHEAVTQFETKKKSEISILAKRKVNLEKTISINDKIDEIIERTNNSLKNWEASRDFDIDKIAETARERSGIIGQIKILDEQQKDLETLQQQQKCPTCRQKINSGSIQQHVSTLTIKKAACENNIVAIDGELDMIKRSLLQAKLKIESITSKLNDLEDEKFKEDNILKEIELLNAEIEATLDTKNPYTKLIFQKEQHLRQMFLSLESDRKHYHEWAEKLEAANFWTKGFKRIRLFIIEQAFQTLEVEVNNCLAQLGMPDWQISFDVERENKSGGVTKGFMVFVHSPANTGPVRWENWSGGETQRLQLAGTLGLANLIMQANGLQNHIEFFDEPSTHLSPEGMLDLANTLHERAMIEGKQIWIVDHAAITNFGDFEGIIEVEKTKNGSAVTFNPNR